MLFPSMVSLKTRGVTWPIFSSSFYSATCYQQQQSLTYLEGFGLEYTDCNSCKHAIYPKKKEECPRQHLILKLWWVKNNSFIDITPRSTLTRMMVPIRILTRGQIDLFSNYLYQIGILDTIQLCKDYFY